jgi:fibronectin-binding autotransporter adhesin
VLPVAGFAFTRTKTDPIRFDNGDTLEVDDFDNQTGFIGATLARSVFSEDGNSAFNQFVTATHYNDFGKDPTSTFTYVDPDTAATLQDDIISENLGAYTELSVGLNYVRILNPGQAIPARQLNASIRADARFGEQLESWGVTGQLRLQF